MPNVDSHAPGHFCWVELGTTDQAAARTFYQSLFGWEAAEQPMGPGQTSVEKAKGLGAKVTMGPQDLPGVGRIALLNDPQGAAFYVIQLTGVGH